MTAESSVTGRHDFAIFILHLSFFNPSSFTETTSRQNGFHQPWSRVRGPNNRLDIPLSLTFSPRRTSFEKPRGRRGARGQDTRITAQNGVEPYIPHFPVASHFIARDCRSVPVERRVEAGVPCMCRYGFPDLKCSQQSREVPPGRRHLLKAQPTVFDIMQ
jgi:hypothetical protein